MNSRLSQHLHSNNMLVTEQYGFRKGISTEDIALRLKDTVFKSIHQNLHVGGIFCVLAKACGFVNREILLAKVHFCAIRGVSQDWFRFCLNNRRQNVEVQSPNSIEVQSPNSTEVQSPNSIEVQSPNSIEVQ